MHIESKQLGPTASFVILNTVQDWKIMRLKADDNWYHSDVNVGHDHRTRLKRSTSNSEKLSGHVFLWMDWEAAYRA